MKILISRISPGIVGGAELSAFDQAVTLKELGHCPILATNISALKVRAKKESVQTVWFPWINKGPGPLRIIFYFLFLPFTYFLAIFYALTIRPDIINPQSREDQNAFTLTKKIHKIPVVWKDAGDLRPQLSIESGSLPRRINQKIQGLALKKANWIYLLNEDDRHNLAKKTSGQMLKKTSVIPASILYKYYNRKANPLEKNNKIIVGTLARAEENKGLQYLLKAINNIDNKNVEYWLVNDGAYKPALQEIARHSKNRKAIKFLPYTPNVSEYLSTFDILVHPAEEEAWGRIIKESMYFGIPVIGSDVGGVKQQIKHNKNGLLFEVGNVQQLTKHLNSLLYDEKVRERLGKAAREKAEAEGDFTDIVKNKIIPLYQRLM